MRGLENVQDVFVSLTGGIMKRYILLLLLFASPLFAETYENSAVKIWDFSGGINLYDNSLKILDNESQDSQNVQFDKNNTLYSRQGYSLYMTLPENGTILSSIEYTPGTGERYFIVQIDSNVYATKDAGSSWITIKEGLKTIYPCEWTIYDNEAWATNRYDDVFSWNAATTTTYGFIPKCRYITTHFGQLVLANSGNEPSAVYMNNPYWGAKNIQGWNTSKYIFYISRDDGDEIKGIASFKNDLVIFKEQSTSALLGYGSDMSVVNYSNEYGCIANRTIKEKNGKLRFISKRGICQYSNGIIQQLDKNIESLTTKINISNLSTINKRWTQNTIMDFYLGTSSNVSIAYDYISLVPDETRNNRNNKRNEAELLETYLTNGWLGRTSGDEIQIPETAVISLPEADNYRSYSVENIKINLKRERTGIYQSSVTLKIYDLQGTLKGQNTKYLDDLGTGTWYTFFDTFTVTVDQSFEAKMFKLYRSEVINTLSYLIYYSEDDVNINYEYASEYTTRVQYETEIAAWALEGWEIVNSIFRSNIVIVKLRRPLYSDYQGSLALDYQYSINASTWGYFISQEFDAGTNITAWKNFEVVDKDNGDIIYQIRYATGSTALSEASWSSISNGDIISATTSQHWIQWKTTLNNKDQRVYTVNLNWFEGQTSDYQSPSSVVYDNNYITTFSTYGIVNTTFILEDRNNKYTKWTGINAGILTLYNNNLYFSGASDNKIYKLYDTWNDSTTAIDKYWVSKDFGYLNADSQFTELYVTAKGSGTLIVGYKGNYDTSYTTMPMTLSGTVTNEVFAITDSSAQQYWNIKLENAATDEYFEIINCGVYLKPEEIYPR